MKNKYQVTPHLSFLDKVAVLIKIILSGIVALALIHSAWAGADTIPATGKVSGEEGAVLKVNRDARGRKVQYVDFSDALIEGKARTPDGFVLQSRKAGKFNSLIELRSHFRENIKIHALEGNASPGDSD
jgi:hypothetical protein